MNHPLLGLGLAASLLAASLAAPAAGVVVESFLITQHSTQVTADFVLNAPSCGSGDPSNSLCTRRSEFLHLSSPPLDTGTLTTTRSAFDIGNDSQVPNFVMNGTARAFANLGQLHASTFVQIQGAGGSNVSIGGRTFAQVTDNVTVKSSVLPNGTPVTVRARLDVNGSGGGRLSFGVKGFNQQVDRANDLGAVVDRLDDFETTFSAKVGESFDVIYGLVAYTRMISDGWGPGDVLNGRNNSADYGNSAFLYMAGLDPSQGVFLANDSGYDYAFPSAVPLPGAALLLTSVLPLLWATRRGDPRAR